MATITELLVRIHPWNMVENGVAAFNGGLIGSVIPALHPLLIPDSRNPDTEIIVCVVIGSVARLERTPELLFYQISVSVFSSLVLSVIFLTLSPFHS